jgi:putative hemolysin
MILEILLLVLLALLNAVLTAGEMALATAPVAALEARGAHRALRMAVNPRPVQAAVQLGVTKITVLAGAFAGITLGLRLSGWLADLGVPLPAAQVIGVLTLVALVASLFLVAAELAPRQIAIRHPARIAQMLSPVLAIYVTLATPAVNAIEFIGRALLGVMGQGRPLDGTDPTALIEDGSAAGASITLAPHLTAADLMTPMSGLASISLSPSVDETRAALDTTTLPAVPVQDAASGQPLGFASLAELAQRLAGTRDHGAPLADIASVPPLAAGASAAMVVAALRASPDGLVPVVDGEGKLSGVVSLGAVLQR